MDEMSSAFKKLLQDNKNGAVMTMSKEKGAPAKFFYVKQQWNEIEWHFEKTLKLKITHNCLMFQPDLNKWHLVDLFYFHQFILFTLHI